MARRRYGSFTPARRAALKKAQAASARKRSRLGRVGSHISRNRVRYAGLAGVAIAGGVLGSRGGRRPSRGAPPATKIRSRVKVDRDAIPMYNPNANKNWPHVGSKQAKKKNKKMRREGLLE